MSFNLDDFLTRVVHERIAFTEVTAEGLQLLREGMEWVSGDHERIMSTSAGSYVVESALYLGGFETWVFTEVSEGFPIIARRITVSHTATANNAAASHAAYLCAALNGLFNEPPET